MSDMPREKGSQINPDDVTVPELQDELRELDQPVTGTKPELIDRLEEARAEGQANQEDPVAVLATTVPDADDEDGEAASETRGDGSTAFFSNEEDAQRAEEREQASAGYDVRERGSN